MKSYDDMYEYLERQPQTLSGGQKQRLLIARSMAAKPNILILDDASSALDYKTDANLRQALAQHFKDTTIVTVAQRVSSIMHADLILVLDDGRVIEVKDFPGFAEKVDAFVKGGGTYVATYISGWVNEENLAFLGGYPGPLRSVLGIWDEETDALDETQANSFCYNGTKYACKEVCALVHPETAQSLAVYEENFYQGMPVLTKNNFGNGSAYYIAARTGRDFLKAFYGELAKETAIAVKEADKAAKVIGGVQYSRDVHYMDTALSIMGEYIDAITFHEYTADEQKVFSRVRALRALCDLYNPAIEIIQGESGSQSRSGGAGALKRGAWTPRKQAKQLLRHTVADLMTEVKFASYFTCVDMIEALLGDRAVKSTYMDYGYFGVLGAEFDEEGFAIGEYSPKPSYYALQNLCSLFAEKVESVNLPILIRQEESTRIFGSDLSEKELTYGGFRKPNGTNALFYWAPTDLMTIELESTISLQIAGLGEKVKLVDPMDGSVYELPENMIEKKAKGQLLLKNVPVKDYPMALVFGDYLI